MKRRWEYKKSSPSNLFGAFGYTIWLMSLALTIVVYFVWLAWESSGTLSPLLQERPSTPTTGAPASVSLAAQIIGYSITVLVTTVAIFVAVTLPYWIGRWSSRLLKRGMALLRVPERSLSLLWAKITIVTLVVCMSGAAAIWLFDSPLQDVALTALLAMSMALVSLVLFALQHYMAKVGRIDSAVLW